MHRFATIPTVILTALVLLSSAGEKVAAQTPSPASNTAAIKVNLGDYAKGEAEHLRHGFPAGTHEGLAAGQGAVE
jgi:hypothetical protein